MSVYYTGTGDKGETNTLSDKRVSKASGIIEAIGSVDELNSAIGIALCKVNDGSLKKGLESIQNTLFIIGANLASFSNPNIEKAKINPESVKLLEEGIESMSKELPELKEFVLPGGSDAAASLHLARAIARRAERDIIRASEEHEIDGNAKAYINRLSSYLFVAALYSNYKSGTEEKHPTY